MRFESVLGSGWLRNADLLSLLPNLAPGCTRISKASPGCHPAPLGYARVESGIRKDEAEPLKTALFCRLCRFTEPATLNRPGSQMTGSHNRLRFAGRAATGSALRMDRVATGWSGCTTEQFISTCATSSHAPKTLIRKFAPPGWKPVPAMISWKPWPEA